MSSYRDLQKIYEGGFRGMSYSPSPNSNYTRVDPSTHSYRGTLPFNAGGSDNEFARMSVNTVTAIADDEEHAHNGVISKVEILDKIKELQRTANNDEMMYAVHLLGQLKEYVKAST